MEVMGTATAQGTMTWGAGLRIADGGEVPCTFIHPDDATAWRGLASTGMLGAAIAAHGEAAVRGAVAEAQRSFTRPDGSIRHRNVFRWVAAVRPA